MQWDTEMMKYVFQQSKLCEGGTRPWEGEFTSVGYEQRGITLLEMIWDDVIENEDWKEDELLLKQVPC